MKKPSKPAASEKKELSPAEKQEVENRIRAKVAFIHYFINVGTHKASRVPLPLEASPSPFFNGLLVTSKRGTVPGASPFKAVGGPSGTLIVGTIRMGFGHHRIAYAAASWGVASGKTTYFHDLLNIESPEATMIREMDKGYSKASRLATELGGWVSSRSSSEKTGSMPMTAWRQLSWPLS